MHGEEEGIRRTGLVSPLTRMVYAARIATREGKERAVLYMRGRA